jgi:hypothetical protein
MIAKCTGKTLEQVKRARHRRTKYSTLIQRAKLEDELIEQRIVAFTRFLVDHELEYVPPKVEYVVPNRAEAQCPAITSLLAQLAQEGVLNFVVPNEKMM